MIQSIGERWGWRWYAWEGRAVPQHDFPLSFPQVLADQLGLSCSLVRGDYGRHWNEVTMGTEKPRSYVINLMAGSDHLLPVGSPQAHHYQHL